LDSGERTSSCLPDGTLKPVLVFATASPMRRGIEESKEHSLKLKSGLVTLSEESGAERLARDGEFEIGRGDCRRKRQRE
jgi:hypothetical protein